MEENEALTAGQIEGELRHFPPTVLGDFQKGREAMSSVLDDEQIASWAQVGLALAQQTVRSWEAASQYFRASPRVVRLMPYNYFVKWAECGSGLCQESPAMAASYFDASPGVMAQLRSRHIEVWANLGRSLYKGTWKSSTLSCKFFESSPALLESLTVTEMGRFTAFLGALSHRSYDVTVECLDLGKKLFPLLGDDKDTFVSLGSAMAETSWRQVKSLFEAAARALPSMEASQRVRFLRLADSLLRSGSPNVPAAMLEVSQALSGVDREHHERLLEMAEALLKVSPAAMPEFLKSCLPALERVSMGQLEMWFEEGQRVFRQNSDGGLAYFKVESARSQRMLEALSSSVELPRIKDVMEMYCRALAGSDVKLAASEELVEKNIGWVSSEAPSTEGSTVYLPSHVDRYPAKEENFGWFKVVSTHQVAHLEFGSFRFEFDRPSDRFRDLRARVERERLEAASKRPEDAGGGREAGPATDMQRFFDLFDDRALALDVFTVIEDGRLDARVKAEYPGIREAYLRVQHDSSDERPEIKTLPARAALVELLVRLGLLQQVALAAPNPYIEEARKIVGIAMRTLSPGATIEDTAEATLRIYAIISQVPNEQLGPDDWEEVDPDEADEYSDADADELLEMLMRGMGRDPGSGDEQDYESSQDVDYRGDFKPELVQLLTRLRMQSGEEGAQAITQDVLEEMLKSSAELDLTAAQGDAQSSRDEFASNMLREAGLNLPETQEYGQGPLVHVDENGGALDPAEPQTFVYDEWDFRADDYKPRWCIVRQKSMAEGDPSYYDSTLHSYGLLVDQIRRQFEMMVPEMFRKVRKLESGEEIDIDDVVEAFVDIRSGVGPSEKLFWRRNKVQRDVAVVFLLDTSASTAEAIDDARKVADDWDAPDDPVEYMVWLRARRGEGLRRTYKRIIDLEKEAVVLLIHALEAIGDVYGIYGFSGYGRENVEFYTIKDINEQFSDKVKRRIDRVAPLHATRMGPAIRHASAKLETQDARTKLLFLISDGRPQDRGYSREGVEKEYAVHDTKMALDEAKDKNITAFCLTVDKNGHDYLKTMCQDIGYEVLGDIHALPRRLLYLYKSLTM